jgi:hypothetical protein
MSNNLQMDLKILVSENHVSGNWAKAILFIFKLATEKPKNI